MKADVHNASATGGFVEALEQWLLDPSLTASDYAQNQYMHARIFRGLDRHPRFDSEAVSHFSASEFQTVVERCRKNGVKIIGVEVFTAQGRLLEICFPAPHARSWCKELVQKYRNRADATFSATFRISASFKTAVER